MWHQWCAHTHITTVFHAFESRVLDWSSFFFTADDFKMRFTPEAKQKFIHLLRERFNVGTVYRNQRMRWDSVIAEKCSEFARFLVGRTNRLGFMEPSLKLERIDTRLMREKILSLTQSEAKKRGIGESTLHYLRNNARKPEFTIYNTVMTKLSTPLCKSSKQ